MGILTAIKSVFGFEGVANTALKIVDKISGTDWTPQQRADFILKHAEATRHQSPMRRIIAATFMLEQFVLAMSWLGFMIYGRIGMSSQALLVSHDIKSFLTSDINLTISGIIAFYFLTQFRK